MDQTQIKLRQILSRIKNKERQFDSKLGEIKESINVLDQSVKAWMNRENILDAVPISFLVAISYIICGLVLFVDPSTSRVSSFYLLDMVRSTLSLSSNTIGLAMVWCGVIALLGTYGRSVSRFWKMIALFPQQILVSLQLISIALVLFLNQYPDGYIPKGGSWFILADQIWIWMLAIVHTIWFFSLIDNRKV